jgi:hypothetical protein
MSASGGIRQDPPMLSVHQDPDPSGESVPDGMYWQVTQLRGERNPCWIGALLDSSGRCLAQSGQFASRGDALRLVARALRVAHVEDCYRRFDSDPHGLQFLLTEPAGAVLLIGSPQATTLERERAITALKSAARVPFPTEGEAVGAGDR